MQEDFLHFIWRYKKFNSSNLRTTNSEAIEILRLGQHNQTAGPDFFNAQVRIDGQLWAGNVEIHVKSSDWYVHNHEKDKAYDNVILHVVWEHDTEIYRKDNTQIPTLALASYAYNGLFQNYKKLMLSKSWINCETHFAEVDDFLMNNWIERLFFERLEHKSEQISDLLKASNNDWEAVLFKMLTKNFGLKVNGDSFLGLANSFEFSIVRKLQNDASDLEALFFGQSDLLNDNYPEPYYLDLQKRYTFLKQKFNINNKRAIPLQFFRLRPANFPTIRLSQLANLYHREKHLFSKLIKLQTKEEIYALFNVDASVFWETHYTFSASSKISKKRLSRRFIDLLIINTIIPIKFTFAKANGKENEEEIIGLIKDLKLESNSITDRFLSLKPLDKTALVSQSLIQLKTEYCDKNKCLQCAIGNSLIVKNK